MNDLTRKHIKDIMLSAGNDTIDQFITLINLPDEQFNLIYSDIKDQLKSIFKSKQFQEQLLAQIDSFKIDNLEEEKAAIQELIAELEADNTLSPQKRDIIESIINESILAVYEMVENPRQKIKVKIQRINEKAILPKYAHKTDAGADVFAIEDTTIPPHTTVVIPTGIKVAIPAGYEIQVRPRSGLSLKTSLRVANAPGTIDSEYRGEVGIIIWNSGNLSTSIKKGDKIAQLVIAPVPMIKWEEVDELDVTDRNEGGFGSTDKK